MFVLDRGAEETAVQPARFADQEKPAKPANHSALAKLVATMVVEAHAVRVQKGRSATSLPAVLHNHAQARSVVMLAAALPAGAVA